MKNAQTPTLEEMRSLKKRLTALVDEDLKPRQKTIYNSKIDQLRDDLDKAGISKDLTLREAERALEKWIELLSQTQETVTEVPRPTGPDATTLTSDQLTDLGESAEKRAQQKATIQAREKEAVAKFQEQGEKRYQDQQKAEALKEKQTQELLNQFFKAKVIVVPTEEIPQVQLTKENKEILLATEIAAKEDPATTQKVFEEKIQLALNNSEQEYKESIKEKEIKKSAAHLVETLRNLPDYKSIDEIPSNPKALNTLSIINPLSNPNSPEMTVMIPDKESREEFAKKVQALMLTAEGKRVVDLAGARAIFGESGESLVYSLYGPDTITDFEISSDEKDRDEGVEIDPQAVYEKGKQVYDFINKVRQTKSAEEVTSTALAYYPSYSHSGASVTTKTIATLAKALPAAGAVYGFRQGTLLAHWVKYNNPLLTGSSMKWITAGGVRETVLMSQGWSSKILFTKNFATGYSVQTMQFASGSKVLYISGGTFGNKAFGVYAQKVAGKMVGAGTIAVKASGQVVAKAIPAAVLSKIGSFVGTAGGPVGIVIGFVGGEIIGRLISKAQIWFKKNKDKIAPIFGVGAALTIAPFFGAGPAVLGGVGTFALFGGSVAGLAYGTWRFFGIIGRSVGIAIATPVIVTLLVLPPLVAFIMLVINNSAYVVPPFFNEATVPPPPIGGLISSCKESEDTGSDITNSLSRRIKNGVVKLLPETVWGRRDGICIKPTMIIMHWSGGTNDNPDGNQRTYETLVARNLSCQLATDTNDTWLMQRFFEKQVEFPACAGVWNTYSINNEMAGVYFTANPPPPNTEQLELTYNVTCEVMKQYNIPWTQIRGHYHVPNSNGKTDPGKDFLEKVFIPEIKQRCPNDRNDEVRDAG